MKFKKNDIVYYIDMEMNETIAIVGNPVVIKTYYGQSAGEAGINCEINKEHFYDGNGDNYKIVTTFDYVPISWLIKIGRL